MAAQSQNDPIGIVTYRRNSCAHAKCRTTVPFHQFPITENTELRSFKQQAPRAARQDKHQAQLLIQPKQLQTYS